MAISKPRRATLGAMIATAALALAAVFVPYYLYKTRPEGRRLPAIAGFAGLVFACMIASAIGAMLMSALSGRSPAIS